MKIRTTSIFAIIFFSGILLCLLFITIQNSRIQKKENESDNRRYESSRLADQLRQSSDDLTRMARTYVITGDSIYEKYFNDILAIRDGKAPRPENYQNIYWDLVISDKSHSSEKGESISLEQLMKEQGFTEEELTKIQQAHNESDALVSIENRAMAAVKGVFADSLGNLLVTDTPDLELARNLLHGDEYHEAKKRIMTPINEFFNMVDNRTQDDLKHLQQIQSRNSKAIVVLVVLLIGLSAVSFFWISAKILVPIKKLSVSADNIAKGDYNKRIDITSSNEIGALAKMFNLMAEAIEGDISEIKKAEEEIVKANENAEYAADIARMGYWELDLRTLEFTFNDLLFKLLHTTAENEGGYIMSSEEYLKRFVHPDDRKILEEHIQSVMSSTEEISNQFEYRVIAKDGNTGYGFTKYKNKLNKQGQPMQVSGIHLDITERKAAEEELRKFQFSVENNAVPTVWIDSNGRYKYVNKAFLNLIKYDREEILKMTIHDVNPEFPPAAWPAHYEEVKKKESIFFESIIQTKEGVIVPVEIHSNYAKGVQNEEGWIFAQKTDITERKKAEEEIKEAKSIAEAATKSKSEFLANMSHEIRTPMNAIIGMSHLALKTDLNPKQQDYLNKVDMSAKSLLGLINDILDFSKIEAGKLDMESVDFDLMETIENVGNMINIKAVEKDGLEVLFSIDSNAPRYLVGDPLRLGQVMTNLGNNAVKFTEKGEIVLAVKMLELNDDIATLRFSVQDSGIGLTEEQRGKLFQAFSQADTTTSRKYGGTGLGLTISKRLVNMMDGDIWVESEPGVGSEFIFTVKLGIGEGIEAEPLELTDDLLKQAILVVDDSSTARQILIEMLESIGFKADEASSGAKALSMVEDKKDKPYGLIMTDWKMPDIDGIELSRRIIDKSGPAERPKIILVTAYAEDEAKEAMKGVDIDGLVIKPATPSDIFDAIMIAFGKEISGRSTKASKQDDAAVRMKALRGSKLLLVEDNEINQQVAKEILEDAGFNVTIAVNGLKGVEAVKAADYDAVLMDIQMPVMDGYEATNEIRKDIHFDDLPILAMTASALVSDQENALNAGMNDHIAKPIVPKDLFSALERWIKPMNRTAASAPEQTVSKSEDVTVDIPEMLGIDVNAGLKRVANNKKLYRNILVKFHDNYTETTSEIKAAYEAGDMELAHRLAHTIKGVSGNIAALELHQKSTALDNDIDIGGTEKFDALLDDFDKSLTSLIDSLSVLKTVEESSTEGELSKIESIDKDAVLPLMIELKELLEDDDADVADVLDKLKEHLGRTEIREQLSEMERNLGQYDFEEAHEVLSGIAEKLDVSFES